MASKIFGFKFVLAAIAVLGLAGVVYAQTTVRSIGSQQQYTFTGYPLFMALVVQSDSNDLTHPGYVRANADGQVTFICFGNSDAQTMVQDLVAGETIQCLVRRVLDTGTDAITLHVSY